jgi:hypothetical protein
MKYYWKTIKKLADKEFPAPEYVGTRTKDNIRSIIPQVIAEKQKFGTGVIALEKKYHVGHCRMFNLMNDQQMELFEELCLRDRKHKGKEFQPKKKKRRKRCKS